MTTVPEYIEADARPAIARPTISATDVGAAPHTAEPTSKMTIEMRKMVFVL